MRSALYASLLAAASLALGGCWATSGGAARVPTEALRQQLPTVPDRYRTCFAGVTDLPAGAWSPEVTAEVVGELRASELGKTECGRQFLLWYEDVRAGRSGEPE